MATYSLRRFSYVSGLKAIAPKNLRALLEPYSGFFAGRGVTLPPPTAMDGWDHEALVHVLMNPNGDTPDDLSEALYFIHEMATPEAMNDLLVEAEKHNVHLNGSPDPTPADIAVQMYLQRKDIVEKKHAEQYLVRPRSFEHFVTEISPIPIFTDPAPTTLQVLERDMDRWFEGKKRGGNCRVFSFPKGGEVWFLVRHGEPYKREGSIENGQSSSVFYRPEKHDVLVYVPATGEIRMNARSKGEKDLYRRMFGFHLFGDEKFFPGNSKYSLEPLRRDGAESLVCTDVEGIDWIRLKQIEYFWGGPEREKEIRKAEDVFAALSRRDGAIPRKAALLRASFLVKFSNSKTPRTINVKPPNVAQYMRDSDSIIAEDWLVKRGFVVTNGEHQQEQEDMNVQPAMAIS